MSRHPIGRERPYVHTARERSQGENPPPIRRDSRERPAPIHRGGCAALSRLLVAPLEALTDPELTDPERRVLLALHSFRDKNANTVWPKVDSIAERANLKDRTRVSKLTSSLAEKGWCTKKKRGFTGGNEYTLTFPDRLSNLDSEATLDDAATLDGGAKLYGDANSNLDGAATLAGESNLDPATASNLDSDTTSNLDSAATYKEQTIEQTNEQDSSELSSPPKDSAGKRVQVPYKKIIGLYHEMLPELPRFEKLTSARQAQIRQRFLNDLPTGDHWRNFFAYVRQSRFLMGLAEPKTGQPPFRADLQWLTKESNFARIQEEFYHRG